jgi:acyl-CoA thioester hydrolase
MSKLSGYSVVVRQPVQWGDMDAYQHVNNTVYLRWFETGRAAYFDRAGLWNAKAPMGIGPIFASVQCRYKAPVRYPDDVLIGVRVVSVDVDRFVIEHAVFSVALDRVAAEGQGVIVAYDYAAEKKALVPAAWREAFVSIEGRPFPLQT